MVKYSFSLNIKGTNDEYTYSIDLTPNQEDDPKTIFTYEIRENLRNTLQEKSLCAIKDNHLNQIIQTWLEDISEGFRNSHLTLKLPLLIESKLEKLHETGNQNLPTIITPNLSTIEPKIGKLPPLDF
ncbi:MAG: hypothetical protein EAZ76_15055 [Nostocales cyanobacterium]|nr:MAG: hypothetical protein EAZ87_10800 [Nostocales cyanobacterium]TAF11311.1 MAG: hypothetical protein EAZ76_15055 [Nostocales cyanobacterium]